MSYANVDHAGWVERNMAMVKAAAERSGARKRRTSQPGVRYGWAHGPDTLSLFQAKAFDILGMALGGIYNAPIVWDAIQWSWGSGESIAVPVRFADMSTFDTGSLTRFVLLCHVARIRGEIRPNGPRGLLLILSQRSHGGSGMESHPDLAEALAAFDAFLPADHRVRYQVPTAPDGNDGGQV